MRVPWGLLVYALWFAVMVISFVVTGLLIARKGLMIGVVWGLGTIIGGILMFGFTSAVIGLFEMTAYYTHPAFFISLGIGTLGALLLGLGCSHLRR